MHHVWAKGEFLITPYFNLRDVVVVVVVAVVVVVVVICVFNIDVSLPCHDLFVTQFLMLTANNPLVPLAGLYLQISQLQRCKATVVA